MSTMPSNPFAQTSNPASRPNGPVGPTNPFGPSSTQATTNNAFGAPPMAGFSTSPSTPGFSNPFSPTGSDTENGFNAPGSSLLNLGQVPQAGLSTYTPSPEVQNMLNGNGGFSPQALTAMNANANESAAAAGQQQMAQVKRNAAQNGVSGSQTTAAEGTVARQTGEQQQQNLQQVQMANAQAELNQQNMAAQLVTQAGEGNMQAANTLALQNAQMLYNALLANQNTRTATQFNIYGGSA